MRSSKLYRNVYRKDIFIVASVTREDGKTVCSESFGMGFLSFFFKNPSMERQYRKAHKWCDKVIEQCKKYETI